MNAGADTPPMSPVADMHSLKRKGEFSAYFHDALDVEGHPNSKRQRIENKSSCPVGDGGIVTSGAKSATRARTVIEAQFSLEILLKHQELRNIDLEIAKCQAALEQLRRCHLIPFPGAEGLSLDVSNGTGSAVARSSIQPEWAPAFGVTDGPYSRHYSKWLLPDPKFDGIQWTSSLALEGRSMRYTSDTQMANKSRSRVSVGNKLQALAGGHTPSKEASGPATVRRANGQVVKLVCLVCKRENFGSTQGFINHCRIAHHREYKSHEEAAIACGQPYDGPAVVIKTSNTTTNTLPAVQSSPAMPTGAVHPLIRSVTGDRATYQAILSRIEASTAMFKAGKLSGFTSIPGSNLSTPSERSGSTATITCSSFVPAVDAPHLSALLRKKGFGGNLAGMIQESRQRFASEEPESDGEQQSTPATKSTLPSAVPTQASNKAASSATTTRPASSKGTSISPRLALSTPVIDTVAANQRLQYQIDGVDQGTDVSDGVPTPMSDGSPLTRSSFDLSPNTASSHNAPSLVSDDDEDGDIEIDSDLDMDKWDGEDDKSDDAEIVDIEVIRKGSADDQLHNHVLGRKERHVTFVSPVKEKPTRGRK